MIQQRFDGVNEPQRVRQLGVTFERFHIAPSSVNVELVRVPYRSKPTVAETARLETRRPLYVKHRLMDILPFAGTGMKPGEYKDFHMRFLETALPEGLSTAGSDPKFKTLLIYFRTPLRTALLVNQPKAKFLVEVSGGVESFEGPQRNQFIVLRLAKRDRRRQ
jgi:hypothetical protein